MAIKVKCIKVYKDEGNNIVGYRLKDINEIEADFYADVLKDEIRKGNIDVVNLTLTKDNRLVNKSNKAKCLEHRVFLKECKSERQEAKRQKLSETEALQNEVVELREKVQQLNWLVEEQKKQIANLQATIRNNGISMLARNNCINYNIRMEEQSARDKETIESLRKENERLRRNYNSAPMELVPSHLEIRHIPGDEHHSAQDIIERVYDHNIM